jgi:ankyrin repeat protein
MKETGYHRRNAILLKAASYRHMAVVQLLLENGADIEAKDRRGKNGAT